MIKEGRYKPRRIYECFLDENDEIEITTKKGAIHLSGILRNLWYMLDGKNSIKDIALELCSQLNISDYDLLEKS